MIQGCGSSSSTGPESVLLISNLRARPLGPLIAERPTPVEFIVTVSDPQAVVGGGAGVRQALGELPCQAPEKGPVVASVPIQAANVVGTTVTVVMALRLPAGRNRLCFVLVTASGAAETPRSGQTALTVRQITSNELELVLDVRGVGGPVPSGSGSAGAAAPPAPPPRPVVSITALDAAAAEPADPGVFQVTRTGSTKAPLTVSFTVAGTAAPGVDYGALPASVTIPAGAASASLTVTPIDDGVFETPETIVVTLTPAAAYAIGSPSTATVTLTNDDGTITVVASDAAAAEPSNGGQFRFSRSGTPGPALTVFYTVSGTAAPGGDYVALSGSATFTAGASTVNVAVTTIDDADVEGPETITVAVTPNAAYLVGSPNTATVNLTSNDGTVTVRAQDATAAEPISTGFFRFTRSGTPGLAVTVFYTVTGTATAGTDYTALSGSVTIPDGAATADVPVTPIDDDLLESPETIIVTLTASPSVPPTYLVGSPSAATVNLTSDDGTVTVRATDASAAEPTSTGNFRFSRTGGTGSPLTVFYTVSGSATPGSDYAALSGTATIPAGASLVNVPLTPLDDLDVESPETITVTLTPNPATYLVGSPSTATVNLTSNDGTVTVTAADGTAAEQPLNTGRFRFSRSDTPVAGLPALTVPYTVSGTATPGPDYAALSGSAIIPVGASFVDVVVTPVNDLDVEGPETVIVTLTPNAAYTIGGSGTATVTINSNE